MRVIEAIPALRQAVAAARAAGRSIGFVPTMGYLHEGHLSLVDRCRGLADWVVISIYVNPLQFGPDEDFDRYPRDLEGDLKSASDRGVDIVFAPGDRELYPQPPRVTVNAGPLADRLCGLSRPTHFHGVLTVVAKLFGIVQPDVAVFGQKDFQQAVLIERMVADLDMPVRVEVAPTVRDPDGLAMSSRNAYLSPEERSSALAIPNGLAAAVAAFRAGERSGPALRSRILESLESAMGLRVEYVEIVSRDGLDTVERANEDSVAAVAARVGATRLIDNASLAGRDPGLERLLQNLGGRE